MSEAVDLGALATKLESAVFDKEMTDEEYFVLQKSVLAAAVKEAKKTEATPNVEADYLIGWIGMNDGDRYRIPAENVLAHLNKAFKGGHAGAGILLYRCHIGVSNYIPVTLRNLSKGLMVLESLAKDGYAHAAYELSIHYRGLIEGYENSGDLPPPEHAIQMKRYADEAVALKYSGGYLLNGINSYFGVGEEVTQNFTTAFRYFQEGLEISEINFNECDIVNQLHHWLGHCYYTGEGVGRDRIEGLKHMRIAADMGNQAAAQWLEESKADIERLEAGSDEDDFIYDLDIALEEDEGREAVAEAPASAGEKSATNPFSSFAGKGESAARPILKKPTTH